MAFDTARAAFEGTLLTNFSKASLVEGIAISISAFLTDLSYYQEIYPIELF